MRLALLISGGGTTAEAIIKACREGRLAGVEPVLVIVSREDAVGIKRAIEAGIPQEDVLVIKPADCPTSDAFGEAIIAECKKRSVDIIGQYGWLVKTPENVIRAFEGMMVNQHPGPLDPGRPDFGGKGMYGRRVHCARLLFVRRVNRDFWTEATTQRVAAEFDKGAVLKRKQTPIFENDDVESLQKRLLPVEYEVQIETLADFAAGRVRELTRETPLVRPGETGILEECKQEAIAAYPQG